MGTLLILRQIIILLVRLPALLLLMVFYRPYLPRFIKHSLIQLGPVYIKLGQVLSTRADFLPPALIDQLAQLRDQVPSGAQRPLTTQLQTALGRHYSTLFPDAVPVPIAAGSVAVVYKAVLPTGETVAVKVLRPNVRRAIEANFKLLLGLVVILEKISSVVKTTNISGIIRELQELLLSQTDLTHEVRNYQRFNQVYGNDTTMTVPKVYEVYCSSQVLVTQFIHAVSPYNLHQIGLSPKELAIRVDHLIDKMLFLTGMCHADLHPGNFFWNTEGQLVLIDFGLAHQFSQTERSHVMTFYYSIIENYYDFATEYFLRHFIEAEYSIEDADGKLNPEIYNTAYQVIREQYLESKGRPQFAEIFHHLLKAMYRFRLRLISNYSKIFLTLTTIEGYLYSLDPEFDMIENARQSRMKQAEYASVPEAAEKLVLQDFATYSTARFVTADTAPKQAYAARDQLLFELMAVKPNDFLIDVGCGRGKLLSYVKARGVRGLGISVNRIEHQACQHRGLESVWSSWQEFDRQYAEHYPLADAMTVIEVLFHLATLYENRVGLLDKRLHSFFQWAASRLKPGGRLVIQSLNIDPGFIDGSRYQAEYQQITQDLPWIGFTTVPQLIHHSEGLFTLKQRHDHSADLLPTFRFWQNNVQQHQAALQDLIQPTLFAYMNLELRDMIQLAEKQILTLNRFQMIRNPD